MQFNGFNALQLSNTTSYTLVLPEQILLDKENTAICVDIEYHVRSFYSNKYIIASILIWYVTW